MVNPVDSGTLELKFVFDISVIFLSLDLEKLLLFNGSFLESQVPGIECFEVRVFLDFL